MTSAHSRSGFTAAVLAGLFAVLPVPAAMAQGDTDVPRLRALDFAPFEAGLQGVPADLSAALDQLVPTLTIPRIQALMADGSLTSELLTLYLLQRTRIHDDHLRTFLELNPAALEEAREADRLRAEGTVLGPMHGIPVTLKDNIETAGPMHTTAGAELLLDHIAEADAPLVAQLRAGGAVILGKANLSEFAGVVTFGKILGGATAVGGQGQNPYGDMYPTGGSSSGSAGGVSALLTIVSVGSETSGSLIAPSAWEGVVGMKPSAGVISGEGVIPLILNNDSAGPIARSVTDLAALLEVIDVEDVVYSGELDPNALNGATVGVLATDLAAAGGNGDLLARIAATLVLTGAEVVPAQLTLSDSFNAVFTAFLGAGIRYDMMPYVAARFPDIATPEALYEYNDADAARRVPFGQANLLNLIQTSADITEEMFHELETELTATAVAALEATFAATGADVLVSIGNTHSQAYATAGYPAITVPLGVRTGGGILAALGRDPTGMPAGVTLIGRQGADAALIGYAFAFEQASRCRVSPVLPD